MIYLDNASTTQPDPKVVEAVMPYLFEQYGNPGTLYSLGREAKAAIEKARKQVADFIGAKPEQIIFTSGGTEANNMVFQSTMDYLKKLGRRHIITSSVEHDSVIKASDKMCIKHGFYKSLLGVDSECRVNPDELRELIDFDTGLVSVMFVNNETGTANDIYTIASICRENGALFHTDCVQAAGCCQSLDVNEIGCDFMSLSSHKIHGLKGCGALYVKDPSIISPMICGGISQEFGYRGGTENVAAIVGFGAACDIMNETARAHAINHVSALRHRLFNSIKSELESRDLHNIIHINGANENSFCKILNVRFDGIDAETLVLMLDHVGVCVSAGSACRSREQEPSHVLLEMGISPENARQSIRISFSSTNTTEEIDAASKIIAECVEHLHCITD